MFQVQQHKANEWVSVSIDFKSIDPALRNTRRVGGIWRIIRIADNVVIAQSKSAPADTENSTPETVASAAPAVAAQADVADVADDERDAIKRLQSNNGRIVINSFNRPEAFALWDGMVAKGILDVTRDDYMTEYRLVASSEPVADAEIPFAEGMDDSEQGSEQRVIETTPAQLVAAILGLPVTSERATIWTHYADDTPFPFITDWRKCHQAAWLFAERGAVTGHGRKAKRAKTAHSATQPGAMPTDTKKARKAAKIAEIRANYRQQQQAVAYRKQQAIIQLFQQAWAVGKAA